MIDALTIDDAVVSSLANCAKTEVVNSEAIFGNLMANSFDADFIALALNVLKCASSSVILEEARDTLVAFSSLQVIFLTVLVSINARSKT